VEHFLEAIRKNKYRKNCTSWTSMKSFEVRLPMWRITQFTWVVMKPRARRSSFTSVLSASGNVKVTSPADRGNLYETPSRLNIYQKMVPIFKKARLSVKWRCMPQCIMILAMIEMWNKRERHPQKCCLIEHLHLFDFWNFWSNIPKSNSFCSSFE